MKYGDEVMVYVHDSDKSLDITLLDNGPGIPEEFLKKVFDPYFRLHTDLHGTGLGWVSPKTLSVPMAAKSFYPTARMAGYKSTSLSRGLDE